MQQKEHEVVGVRIVRAHNEVGMGAAVVVAVVVVVMVRAVAERPPLLPHILLLLRCYSCYYYCYDSSALVL